MLLLSLALACTSGDGDSATPVVDDSFPEIWGVAAAVDHDPAADVVEVHLTAGTSTVEWVEGEETEVWSYNGQVPGPLIQANVGDTLRVVFDNQLEEDETTIHWHGLRISDELDGIPAITDPVAPGEQRTFEFVVPDSGSFWYHPHVRSYEQIERGLQGVLVVHEADAPDVARDRYFTIDDADLNDNGGLSGFAIMDHMTAMHGRLGNTLVTNGQTELLTDTVRPSTSERWRIVNTANARTMYVDVVNADWRVIAQDGTLLPEPFTTTRAQVPVGRRVDLEVIPHDGEDQVQLRVLLPSSEVGQWYDYPVFEADIEGEAGDGDWLDWPAQDLPEIGEATQEVALELDADTSGNDLTWTINGQHYGEHDSINVQGNTESLLRISELSGLEHPFHLHGQFFQVVERNGLQLDRDKGLLDTILLDGDDEVVLATQFDNPGRWMAHCHILEHAELGMMTELVVE